MTLRTPLVVGPDGRVQQLQAGDTIPGGSDSDLTTLTASVALLAGQALYSAEAGAVGLARADNGITAKVVGLSALAAESTAPATVQTGGVLELSTAEWDAVAGTAGGLTNGNTYYLSPDTAGALTAAVPTTPGQLVVIVGEGLNSTKLLVRISEPLLL